VDPVKQIINPVAEIRQHASRFVDEYGESWIMIDGVETKVPNIKRAKALLRQQDVVREKIRAALDETGVRDRTEQVEITLDDGTKTTVELLRSGDAGANVLQIGGFPDAEGLVQNAARVQERADASEAEKQRAIGRARLAARSPLKKLRDAIASLLKGNR
jgi:hypothetical protein